MVNDRRSASFAPCPRSREASEAAEEGAGALLDGLPRVWYAECWSSHPARTSTGWGSGTSQEGRRRPRATLNAIAPDLST